METRKPGATSPQRAIVAAHEGDARCLELDMREAVCNTKLQAVRKGLAIGKFCGMQHAH